MIIGQIPEEVCPFSCKNFKVCYDKEKRGVFVRRKKLWIVIVCIVCMALLCSCARASIEDAIADIPRPTQKEPNPETQPQSEPPRETEAPAQAEPEQEPEPLTASYADEALLSSGNYHYFQEDTSEYAVSVAFWANETLSDVALYEMYWENDDFVVGSFLYGVQWLEPEKPLVVDMDFPGDMSCYEICFADARGVKQSRVIYMSGMDGSVVLSHG